MISEQILTSYRKLPAYSSSQISQGKSKKRPYILSYKELGCLQCETYVKVSTKGYKLNKPDKANPYNKLLDLKSNWSNYFVLTGVSNKLVVIDLDTNKDSWQTLGNKHPFIIFFQKWFMSDFTYDDWEDTLSDLIKSINTFTVKTPSGGYHLYFYASEPQLHKTVQIPSLDIDIRGAGGVVVGYGTSFESDKQYSVFNDVEKLQSDNYIEGIFDMLNSHMPESKSTQSKNSFKKAFVNRPLKPSVFKYVNFTSEIIESIIVKLDKSYITSYSNWIKLTRFLKTIDPYKQGDAYNIWVKYGKGYDFNENLTHWDKANTDYAVEVILKAANMSNTMVYHKYKPLLPNLKTPDEITKHRKLEYTEGKKDYINTDSNLVIKADTGTGKTTVVKEYLYQKDITKYISITGRISLAEEQYATFYERYESSTSRIPVYYYKDPERPSFSIMEGSSLVIELESIFKIQDWDFSKYVIFLDEFNSLVEQMLGSDTLGKNCKQILYIFTKILSTCKQFICVDADISDLCFILLDNLNLNYIYRNNIFNHNKGVKSNELFTPDEFETEVKKHNKFLICMDSKTNTELYNQLLEDEDIKVYNSDYKGRIDMNHSKIIISPKVIYGLDSKLSRPVFCVFCEHTISPKSMVQQIARERDITHLYYLFPNKELYTFNDYVFETVDEVIPRLELYDKKFHKYYVQDLINFDVGNQYQTKCKYHILGSIPEDSPEQTNLYNEMMKFYLFNMDAYSTNKYLHFKLILEERGFIDANLRSKSCGFTKEEREEYECLDEMRKLSDLSSGYTVTDSGVTFTNPIHQERYDLLKLPKEMFERESKLLSTHIKLMLVNDSDIRDHFKISDLFIRPESQLQYNILKETNNEFDCNRYKSEKANIQWLRNLMMKSNVVSGTLNADPLWSESDAKQYAEEYKDHFRYRGKPLDFTSAKEVSKTLFTAVKQLVSNVDKLVTRKMVQTSKFNSEGKRPKHMTYTINPEELEIHTQVYNYRIKK